MWVITYRDKLTGIKVQKRLYCDLDYMQYAQFLRTLGVTFSIAKDERGDSVAKGNAMPPGIPFRRLP